jgi:uncharacterized protein
MTGVTPAVTVEPTEPLADAGAQHRTRWQESVLSFECESTPLWGVVAEPDCVNLDPSPSAGTHQTAIVIIVGGPQYRVGSHRQFVLTARHLAEQGFPVLRFDYRGMGDSAGETGHFERVNADVRAAIDALLQAKPQIQRVVLWGLCDGASAALLYCRETQDPRVAGLVLLNPWVRSLTTQAVTRVKHYYLQRLRDRAFWRKLVSGQVAASALTDLMSSLRVMLRGRAAQQVPAGEPKTFQDRMAAAWQSWERPLLLAMSGNDQTAREFEEACAAQLVWRGALGRALVTRYDAADADHTFSQTAQRSALDARTVTWLQANGW